MPLVLVEANPGTIWIVKRELEAVGHRTKLGGRRRG